eukprot:jgi/Botrbrau1/6810/Bobra.0153s0009.4
MRGYADRFEDFVDDAALLLDDVHRAQGPPVFVLGESMGGTIVLRLMMRPAARQKVQGIVLLAPVVRVAPAVLPPAPLLLLLRLLAFFFPRMSVPSQEVDATFDSAFGDPAMARAARADPLVVFDAPRLRMVVEVLGACKQVVNDMEKLTLPMLVLHGSNDSRTDFRNSVELIDRAASSDKRLDALEEGRHQLLQDVPDLKAAAIARIVEWVLLHS